MVLGETLGALDLYPPHGDSAKSWNPGDEGLSESVVRLQLPNSATVSELVSAMTIQNSEQIQLSIDHAPCYAAPDGMRCVEGTGHAETLYVDTQPVSVEALQSCRKDRVCRDPRGSWGEAAQLCAHQGKRLPTLEEVAFADMSEALWVQDWDRGRAFQRESVVVIHTPAGLEPKNSSPMGPPSM